MSAKGQKRPTGPALIWPKLAIGVHVVFEEILAWNGVRNLV